MKNPLVSIIVPLYNSESYIAECVESCLKQNYPNIEVIVINDGSTDKGREVVDEIKKQAKKLSVFHTTNKGVSAARNLGIEKAKGEFVCFVDADDCLDPNFVEYMLGLIQKDDADFGFSKNCWGEENDIAEDFVINDNALAEKMLIGMEVAVGCWNKIYRRKLLDKIKFDTDLFYGEGLDFIMRVAENANGIGIGHRGLYHYRRNPNSATTVFDINKMVNGEKALLKIRDLIVCEKPEVKKAFNLHYCLFCANAVNGILRSGNKKEYKAWKRKLNRLALPVLLSQVKLRFKAKIILTVLVPRIISYRTMRKRKGMENGKR